MKLLVTKIIFLTCAVWLMPWPVLGASINFNPVSVSVPQAKPFTVTIMVDTEGKSINAIDGIILVPQDLGNEIAITDSGSIITYWIQQPTWDVKTRAIKFSGAVPGGYQGSNGILLSVTLPLYSGPKLNNGLTVTELHSYQNDGLGTPLNISSKQFVIGGVQSENDMSITDQLYLNDKKQDSIPPETFSPQVARDANAFDNKWFVSFATTDKQSGIYHYEIQESQSGRINSANWKTVSSPYVLEDQDLHSFIYITAVDRQGNERVIKVFPKNSAPWWFRYGWDVLIIVGIIFLIIVGYWYHKIKVYKDSQSIIVKNDIV